ncbi:M50 family metallopeptidase [[Mycobacterium] crassicus]|uniref:M50 family metallopeptidase n=1 Tax=[Mycobacterium] crassicus TaxID=2872309 RepID=A0ABU5XPJ0_9MYCO|nr:M50 family metallopeptidase [Mycolicibacter sp. MYC098]MEB3023924.1 M50 family metallopeptidase [Mycolicibacter sp. MYC098]
MDQRTLTAHHEAGHAVAAVMRGGTQLHYVNVIQDGDTLGFTHYSGRRCDEAFIAYAGPWAEARAQWPISDLNDEDDDGCTFPDYVTGAFLTNIDGDAEAYQSALKAELLGPPDPELLTAREGIWGRELQRAWPVVQQVAQLLAADGADMYHSADHRAWHDVIRELLDRRQ